MHVLLLPPLPHHFLEWRPGFSLQLREKDKYLGVPVDENVPKSCVEMPVRKNCNMWALAQQSQI